MVVEIVCVGTELLLGDIVNTNAQYIASKTAELGFSSYYQTVVGDNMDRIKDAFEIAFSRSDIVITTGGLGPTADDMTKEAAAEFFEKEMVFDENAWKNIEDIFNTRGIEITASNRKQAYFPKGSKILYNENGTAPGCIIEDDGRKMIILPGPPREMVPLFEKEAYPYLRGFSDLVIFSKNLRICGVGESKAAEMIKDLLNGDNPTVAPYAKEGEVVFRITSRAADEQKAKEMISPVEDKIRAKLGINIYGEGDTSLENEVGKILIDRDLKIAVAESCTGGLVCAKLVNCPGISSVFIEGDITYSNEAKMRSLGVSENTLEKFGAVSEQVASEMAKGIAIKNNCNIGLSTTGVAGPDGGTPEKPVGLVYIGIYINGDVKVKKITIKGNRERIRKYSAVRALDLLRRELI